MTTGLSPSITATTELVVPRSIPITFAIDVSSSTGPHRNLLGLQARRLQDVDAQHAVAQGRRDARCVEVLGHHERAPIVRQLELLMRRLEQGRTHAARDHENVPVGQHGQAPKTTGKWYVSRWRRWINRRLRRT